LAELRLELGLELLLKLAGELAVVAIPQSWVGRERQGGQSPARRRALAAESMSHYHLAAGRGLPALPRLTDLLLVELAEELGLVPPLELAAELPPRPVPSLAT